MNRFKLAIPKPCHEDWDKMTPDANGRFCGSCAKTVVDFTGMKASDIRDYFIANEGQRVCGRFQNKQLDSIVITIPRHVLFSQTQFHKMFLLALFVSMGTMLFSCSDDKGNRQNIDRIEVSDEKVYRTLGAPMPSIVDSTEVPPPPKSKKCDPTAIKSGEVVAEPLPLMGDVIAEPQPAEIKVYKDSITMNGGK